MSEDINVVVPVYHGEPYILELTERLHLALRKCAKEYRIIYIDDCSPDNSWRLLAQLAAEDPRVTAVKFTRNFGQHYAIAAGLELCNSTWVVVMDCDLQDQPEAIPGLLRAAEGGFDVALACRRERHDRLLKRLCSRCFYQTLSFLTGTQHNPEIANFGIYHRRVIDQVVNLHERFRYFPVMIRWLGYPAVEVVVEHDARRHGKSSYTFRRAFRLASEIVLAFSDKPLKIVISFGAIVTAVAFLYGLRLLYRALTSQVSVEGWASVILSIWLLGGILLTTLGVIALYVGRSFEEVKRRPRFVIEKTIP